MKIDSPTFLTETTFISASVQFSSGSQKFGNTSDDLHQFTGSQSTTGTGSFKRIENVSTIEASRYSIGGEPYHGKIYYNNNGNIIHEPRDSYDINFLFTSNEGLSISQTDLVANAGENIGGTTLDTGGLPIHIYANELHLVIDGLVNSNIYFGHRNAGSNLKLFRMSYPSGVFPFRGFNNDCTGQGDTLQIAI